MWGVMRKSGQELPELSHQAKKLIRLPVQKLDEEMTGLGSIRKVKEMKIDFDVFKRLSVGQAILIDKALHREDLFQVWRPVL